MLNADTSTPNTYADMGTFGDVLFRVLREAALRTEETLHVTHAVFNVVAGEYPESISEFDAVIVTASAASSYDMKPWILELEDFLVKLYKKRPSIKIFGSCFGHHMICQALLRDSGLRVVESPTGWEIGISAVAFTEDFRRTFQEFVRSVSTKDLSPYDGSRLPSPDDEDIEDLDSRSISRTSEFVMPPKVRLQFIHEDQVVLDPSYTLLPPPWILLGSTENCAVQGVYQPGRVLTLQGHFEFDKFKNQETCRIFGAEGTTRQSEDTEKLLDIGDVEKEEMDDGYFVAELVIRFLSDTVGMDGVSSSENQEEPKMLPTPRASIEQF